jgi:hypothetical protein
MRKLLLAVLLLAGCTDSTDISLFIPFALFASDELSASSTGICGFTPITQAQGFYKGSGLLELDPAINPNAEYELGLQVENYLDETLITDSNGDPIEGPQRNNFSVEWAIVHYDDLEGQLTGVSDITVYTSGTIRTGGEQNAGSVIVEAVGPGVVGSWVQSFEAKSLLSETVILSVQIFGDLASGEQTQTGVFRFPLTLCWDCGGISPTASATAGGCPAQSTPVPEGHGPCCAPQDFIETCQSCGQSGQPCCGTRGAAGAPSCATSSLTCSGPASTTTTELCPYVNQALVVCAMPTAG